MVTILLWNTETVKENQEVLLETTTADVLAIQEPWLNTQAKLTTYCPRSSNYHLIHQPGGRAALYIHKRWNINQWDYQQTQDWCRITLLGEQPLSVWSIYNQTENPSPLNPSPLHTESPIRREVISGSHILAGDFNLHHPLWDQHERESDGAGDLLAIAELGGLTLRTPYGAVTRAPQGNQRGRTSTIDHFWTSRDLDTTYKGLEDRQRSDHYRQILHISQASEVSIPQSKPTQYTGWAWKRMDKIRAANEAELIPEALGGYQSLQAISTKDDLEAAFTTLS